MIRRLLTFGLASTITIAHTEPNMLDAAEAAAGYDLLFNGSTLDGWHGYRMTMIPDAWTVRTSAPLGPRIETGSGNQQYLLTDKLYMNFDLKVEIQTPANGNSGIFLRYEEKAVSSMNSRSGPEVQICGVSTQDNRLPLASFGSVYDMIQVDSSLRYTWYRPAGEWNELRIVAYDSNIVHYGNGKKLLEYKIGSPNFINAYEKLMYPLISCNLKDTQGLFENVLLG